MASEYLKWKYRDVKPDEPIVLTPREKWKNWWRYHWWHVLLGMILLIAAGNLLMHALGIGQVQPDYQIAYVGSAPLPRDSIKALETAMAELGQDCNGDGSVTVQLHSYTDGDAVQDGSGAANSYAASVTLMADLTDCDSYFFLLIPCAFLGGMIFGPFLAGMVDAVMRGLRDDPENWWRNYKKSWRQNWKGSLLPGGILGLLAGMYAFMLRLFWVAQVSPTPGTVALYAFAGLLLLIINTLYWPQLVLFRQTTLIRMRNIILFTAKYLWKMVKVSLLQIIYMAFIVLFAPWTLILMPLLGFWYIIFLSQFLIYEPLNRELHIEEQFSAVTGWPVPEAEPEDGEDI